MIYDTLIVGGGPAGISAAVYLKRAGKTVAIIEKFAPGGQLNMIDKIENYPGFVSVEGAELAVKFYEQARAFEIPFIYEDAKEYLFDGQVKKVVCSKHTYEAKTVVLALGSFTKPLSVTGEEKFKGRGVSYCATCDGHFFKGKVLAVVGDGDSALVDAMYLSALAKKVYLLCDQLRPVRVKESIISSKENVEILRGVKLQKIEGEGSVNGVVYADADGQKSLAVDGVFVAIGRAPDTTNLRGKLDINADGFIKTDSVMRTSVAGVYAVGDVREGSLKQVVTAAGDGAIAATDIIASLA